MAFWKKKRNFVMQDAIDKPKLVRLNNRKFVNPCCDTYPELGKLRINKHKNRVVSLESDDYEFPLTPLGEEPHNSILNLSMTVIDDRLFVGEPKAKHPYGTVDLTEITHLPEHEFWEAITALMSIDLSRRLDQAPFTDNSNTPTDSWEIYSAAHLGLPINVIESCENWDELYHEFIYYYRKQP